MIDVAIVGAGPAGLQAAATLAAAGLDVHVFEEHPVVGIPAHCTGVVSVEVTRFAELPHDVVLNTLTRTRLHAPGGGTCDLVWDRGDAEEIVVLDRSAFDQHLASVAARAGAKLRMASPVQRIAVERDSVTVELHDGSVTARVVVLACGVSYRFHRQLGAALPGEILHTAQIEIDAPATDRVDVYVGRQIAPDGFLWSVPLMRDGRPRLKIGILARGPAGLWLQRFLMRPAIRHRLALSSLPTITTRVLPLKAVSRSYRDRILLVGDAGGFTKPITGGGIFYSLLTASAASRTLIEAFDANRFDAATLRTYERRWRRQLGGELRLSGWLRRIVASCRDHELDAMIRALAADDIQALIRGTARFNWHRGVIRALMAQRRFGGLLVRSMLGASVSPQESRQAR